MTTQWSDVQPDGQRYPLQPMPGSGPALKPKRFGWPTLIIASVISWIVGVIMIMALLPANTGYEGLPAPSETITETTTPVGAPASCLEALDLADEGFNEASKVMGVAAEVITLMPKVIDAVLAYDSDALEAISAKVRTATTKIEKAGGKMSDLAPKYNAAKAECRGE